MNPFWPLLALACWIVAMTAAIYGRRGLAWTFMLMGLGLLVVAALASRP
jgi:hypothetical protein